jgi:mono/diheme cytochrome c family protein
MGRAMPLAAALALALAAGAVQANVSGDTRIERGRYLARAGDCAACHTDAGRSAYAGGRPVPTPFGTIYSTNITPDRETGIGGWSDEDFWKAMHEGLRPNGERLYPAFPYPWFTKLSRDDVLALKAYLDSLASVHEENKPSDLPWPLSWRFSVAGWNLLFFKPGNYQSDANRSPQWNRGAYLVEGPGHCGACHSPKNLLGAVKKRARFQGGMGEGWFATSLTGNAHGGLGAWSSQEIVDYLATGATDRARALGPMAEVVSNSTRYLTPGDLEAIAAYLKDLAADGSDEASAPVGAGDERLARGHQLYVDQCAGCHMEDGKGLARVFPPIRGSSGLQSRDPTSLVRLVLEGAPSVKTPAKPEGFAMPAFNWKLDDGQVADLLTYLRSIWGNQAVPVEASKVGAVRKEIAKEPAG